MQHKARALPKRYRGAFVMLRTTLQKVGLLLMVVVHFIMARCMSPLGIITHIQSRGPTAKKWAAAAVVELSWYYARSHYADCLQFNFLFYFI